MRTTRHNNDNTIWKAVTNLKTLWRYAIKKGIVTNDVFADVKIKKIQGNRLFLEEHELKTLFDFYRAQKIHTGQQNTLRNFLFACTTGIRFGDMKRLTYTNKQGNIITFEQHKTVEWVRIPISKPTLEMLGDTTTFLPSQKLFRVLSNQRTNEHLREIMHIVGITKNITYHCARHTFATLSLQKGIPIDTISKILGHTNVKTTNIYLKYNDKMKIEYMDKWNNL